MPTPVQIPIESLSRDALEGLIEEFVTREGTDYGERERTLAEKKSSIKVQLQRGEIVIVFDADSETCNLVAKDQLR